LEEMPKEGIKKLLVICPAFVSDCLETLEEIEERGKESFMNAGGESYTMIPCLNTHPLWVEALTKWIKEVKVKSWELKLRPLLTRDRRCWSPDQQHTQFQPTMNKEVKR
jgi:ferrochelatase